MSSSRTLIQSLLPHRPPFLFVEQIISLEPDRMIVGRFKVPADHPCLNRSGKIPVFPPFLVVEAMGQLAGLCVRHGQADLCEDKRPAGYLARVDRCRFERPLYVGEDLLFSAALVVSYAPLYKFEVRGEVAGQCVAQALLTLYLEH